MAADHMKSDPVLAESMISLELRAACDAVAERMGCSRTELFEMGIESILRRFGVACFRSGNSAAHDRATLVDPVRPVGTEWDPNE